MPAEPDDDGAEEGPSARTSRGAGRDAGFQHYFSAHPTAPHATRPLRFLYRGQVLNCTTDRGIFSSEGLDPGTSLLIENMELGENDRVLDLGCGWGAIGIAAAIGAPRGRTTLTDVNHRAVHLARSNVKINHLTNVEVLQGELFAPVGEELFDLIVSNPPYKAGREVILAILQGAPAHLREEGRLLLVGKGSQGILYYQAWLRERWRSVDVLARSSGYRVLLARGPPRQ